jgi:hypothetical protein
MKIRQWLGYNEDASQYLLRPGELRVLSNLQARRPGMLIARKGLKKIYGKYDDEPIFGLYRRATLLGNPSDFLWLQKVLVPRELTAAQIAAQEDPMEYAWMVKRIEGYQSRVIDTQALGSISNFCVAEDRHGRLFIVYGHGVRPRIYRPTDLANVCLDMGLDAPLAAPVVVPSGSGYFMEGVDVRFGGGAYYEPPEITIEGGSPGRPAKLKALVQSGNVIGVDIVDGGLNYQTPPTLTVALDKIGTGFRAKGTVSGSARLVEGFSETDAGTITGTAATTTQTYGSTNGTTGNSILYLSRPRAVTEKVVSASGAVLTLSSVTGIQVGDTVTVYPAATPFSNSTVTVTAISTANSTVTVSSTAFAPAAGTAYEATFTRAATVATAKAEYDSSRRRFLATIPLASTSTSGRNARATLEFSPKGLGYGLNVASASSVSVVNNNWQRIRNSNGAYSPYLYGEYWEGSDYDDKGSAENSRFGGLQASGAQFVRGFSGSVNGRRADVYWPDYSQISVWFCTGVLSNNLNQWTRVDVPVQTDSGGSYIEFRLRPTQRAKTVKSLGGASLSTEYQSYEQLPDAVAPKVRINLTHCPDSWVTTGANCLPTQQKEATADRRKWWVQGTNVARPFVDITTNFDPVTGASVVTADNISISEAGSGWTQGSQFAIRLYQANAYAQRIDYNTAVVEDSLRGGHGFYEAGSRYVQFTLTADTPDNFTPHGPPQTLITPAQVTIPGDGYTTGQTGTITLYRRHLTQTTASAVAAQTITWTAKTLDTLSSTNTGQIASITIANKGHNYFAPPTIAVRGGGNGYGLEVLPRVVNGQIDSLQIIDPGSGYTSSPELYTSARAAELTPVMRPALRGTYRCAYRYADMSETVIKTVTATLGESATTLTLSDTEGVEPEMVLDAPQLPHNAKIKSVNGTQVEIGQQITGLAAGTTITVKVRDLTKPIAYSDLSPIVDVDAGPNDARTHSSMLTWSLPGATPPPRADKVEFWRTSADQSLVFYRTEAYGIPSANGIEIVGTDTLTDEELFDPDRAHYAAMPVVLPNGNLNAYRFGKPRSDMSVAVAFQDRLWMGVSTSGKDANTLYYSEFDEFESCPDTNELPIQNNQKSTDVLTALVPFGSMLLAMQHTHTYAITYNTDPAVDASIQMLSHRGCLHQRCWDIHENTLFAADESGIYALDRSGQVSDISLPMRDFFVSEQIDFSKRETFFLQADPRTHILRFFCVLKSNPTDTPSIALCYDIQAQTWWSESYPNSLTAACTGRPGSTRINTMLAGAVDGNLYEIDGDSDHAHDTLTDCVVVEGGSGYREAPTITAPNCDGAVVRGVVSEGRLVDVIIQSSGWNARGGLLLALESGERLLTHEGSEIGGVEYYPIYLNIGAPEPGGTQAVAYANFSVTPRVVRECTVSLGESFVRIDPARTAQLQPLTTPPVAAQTLAVLLTQSGQPIASEPPPVEVGMEAIGDFIPLNAFVSHFDGNDVHLKHPDGTPAQMVYGAARTNQAGTPVSYLELGGTQMTVTFRKPFRTHIPFRMATGFMPMINDGVDKRADVLLNRSLTLVYTPTAGDKEVEVIERFNGRDEMRPNIARRSRGGAGSFVHRQDSASTVLNTNREASALGFSTGVATATFASRAHSDMTGEDQHLQVELYARPEQASPWQRTNYWIPNPDIRAPQQFVMHSLNIEGVVEDG